VLVRQLVDFDLTVPVRPLVVRVLRPLVANPRLSVLDIQQDSPCAAALFAWVKKVVLQHLERGRAGLPSDAAARDVAALHAHPPRSRMPGLLTAGGSGGEGRAVAVRRKPPKPGTLRAFLAGDLSNFGSDPEFQVRW
jgi:hypothetical protein